MLPQHRAGNTILVGDTIETGGVCRHMGLLVAAIAEQFIKDGVLAGKIYYVRGVGHAWAVYETSGGDPIVLDVAQKNFGYQSGMRYNGGDGYYPYSNDYDQVKRDEQRSDKAVVATPTGGIDLNSANLDLQIKRDGKGVPLPLAQQDIEKLQSIEGFVPVIINIVPVTSLPFLSELQLPSPPRRGEGSMTKAS